MLEIDSERGDAMTFLSALADKFSLALTRGSNNSWY